MVKRLLGFVLLIGIVALLLHWVSLQESQPDPEPKPQDTEVSTAPEGPAEEAPAPEPATPEQMPSTPPAVAAEPPAETEPAASTEQAPATTPAAAASPVPVPPSAPTDEQTQAEPPVAAEEESPTESAPPAPSTTEPEPAVSSAVEAEKPSQEPEPSASAADAEPVPAALPAAEAPAPAEAESPSASIAKQAPSASSATEDGASSSMSEPLPPAVDEQAPASATAAEQEKPPILPEQTTQPTPPAQQAAVPVEPAPDTSEESSIEERVVPDDEFFAVEQAQGRTDERTDAQRRHQDREGWYGWGVLSDYADPDRAARLLGGAAAVQRDGSFFTLRERSGGEVRARPIANLTAAYGSIALRGHGSAFRQRLRRALADGQLLGREADYKLWYLFPQREAAHLGNKVVSVFECHVRESGLSGEAADRFRKESKLRGAVLALRRANGGRLGIYLPRYFRTEEGRVPVEPACRALDEESRRFGS